LLPDSPAGDLPAAVLRGRRACRYCFDAGCAIADSLIALIQNLHSVAMPARFDQLKFERQPPGCSGRQIDGSLLLNWARRSGVPEAFVEIVNHSQL
jgi:hypothetical protein